MAATCAHFVSKLDFMRYAKGLSERKQRNSFMRANRLHKRAATNTLYQLSEFAWEICGWNDVFRQMLNDEAFVMPVRQ